MRKLKGVLTGLVLVTFISAVFAKSAVEPVKVVLSEANLWGTDVTFADGVYGTDGSVTFTAMYKYGGGGYTFNINGKAGINLKDYSTLEIEFDYETGAWEKPSVMPKFGVKYWGAGATFFNGGQALDWIDAESPKGTVKKSISLKGKSGKALRIGIVSNSWQWEGNGDGSNTGDDTVIIKVKSIKFVP